MTDPTTTTAYPRRLQPTPVRLASLKPYTPLSRHPPPRRTRLSTRKFHPVTSTLVILAFGCLAFLTIFNLTTIVSRLFL